MLKGAKEVARQAGEACRRHPYHLAAVGLAVGITLAASSRRGAGARPC